jgi:hypothetical protein
MNSTIVIYEIIVIDFVVGGIVKGEVVVAVAGIVTCNVIAA